MLSSEPSGCKGDVFTPRPFIFNSCQRGYFTSLTPREPPGQVKMVAVDGFHIHIGEVTGLQSFFVFYGPGGTASAVCSAGITIQREVRESSEGPHYSKSNISHIHMAPIPHYWQRELFMPSAIRSLHYWHHQLMPPFIEACCELWNFRRLWSVWRFFNTHLFPPLSI